MFTVWLDVELSLADATSVTTVNKAQCHFQSLNFQEKQAVKSYFSGQYAEPSPHFPWIYYEIT